MDKQETVEVTIRLPKAVFDYIKSEEGNVEEYIVGTIVDGLVSYIECVVPYEVDPRIVMDKYNLKPVFKAYDVLPCYYGDP